jgi:hypothetical protein
MHNLYISTSISSNNKLSIGYAHQINNIMINGYDKNKVDIIAIKGFSLHLKNICKYYKIKIDNEKIKEIIDSLNDTSSAEDIKKLKIKYLKYKQKYIRLKELHGL